GVDVHAGRALAAGLGAGPLLAVQRLGEDAGDGGLAHAAGAGEQEGMVDPPGIQGVAQGADHVLLPDELGETLRAPLAGKNQVGHRLTTFGRASGRTGIVPCRPLRPPRACGNAPRALEFAALQAVTTVRQVPGEVSEWLKEHAWKVCKRLNRASGVRIPLSPPDTKSKGLRKGAFFVSGGERGPGSNPSVRPPAQRVARGAKRLAIPSRIWRREGSWFAPPVRPPRGSLIPCFPLMRLAFAGTPNTGWRGILASHQAVSGLATQVAVGRSGQAPLPAAPSHWNVSMG